MIINKGCFKNGGEVDLTANYRSGRRTARISIRKAAENRTPGEETYEIYYFWYDTKQEEVFYNGDLRITVQRANAIRKEILGKDYAPDVYE